LAKHYAVPTIYEFRHFVVAGGLVSYGPDPHDSYRQAGSLVGRVLKGEKPADLPVMRPSKCELVINLTRNQVADVFAKFLKENPDNERALGRSEGSDHYGND
jgi:ABC-type uncharacterized transport system substrate-binding protein